MTKNNTICPICDMEYHSMNTIDSLDKEMVRNVASNTEFTECGMIVRAHDDETGWTYKCYKHSYDQVR